MVLERIIAVINGKPKLLTVTDHYISNNDTILYTEDGATITSLDSGKSWAHNKDGVINSCKIITFNSLYIGLAAIALVVIVAAFIK